jgi:SAM-dependent methyltransferase
VTVKGNDELVRYYTTHRRHADDLYPSERRFLPWLAHEASHVLDIGCAAGGFAEIWRSYNPRIVYEGVDTSLALVEAARKLHPSFEFHVADCADGVMLPDERADVVQALGWLHWEPRYRTALEEAWRLTKRRLFFDVRLQDDAEDVTGEQRLALDGGWNGEITTPYLVVSWPRFARLLLELEPSRILGYGYEGAPRDTVGTGATVCFATFVLEKGARDDTDVCCELPFAWPEDAREHIRLRPEGCLDELVSA